MNAYDEYQQGMELLAAGHPRAAVEALERARDLEPEKASIREALARAYFNSQRFGQAREEFSRAVAISPADDYAHFGLGLALLRLGDRTAARGHLRMAVAMNPESDGYAQALRRAEG